ncbi:uncharacterized protein LACBIDRAFT_297766 [Laccaria bicolor S238N-H82]|uniref:Predicted protein n=1 Tax=Laccaria bicolor (strain S238N-H82 / ATCC MYA-4686) TaxID=486041 RepID=B0DAU1_LACBS|nr:uncharacterized protein LACBIDRAFT_297766 [Laccaria bicolor S238N-H82]EDR08088.1 predicted protein [Laccaria bicolor S238N-H82]|eukprot:XP_001881158.1 predicted protein [Laccaria bicolor S238N-H82]
MDFLVVRKSLESVVPSLISIFIIGLLLGPMYPIAMNHTSRVLPRWILTGSTGWIAEFVRYFHS